MQREIRRNGRTSCPLRKALIMLFRGEMSKRISHAFAVTERKETRTLREKGVRPYHAVRAVALTVHQQSPRRYCSGLLLYARRGFELLWNEEGVEPKGA